jgi:cation transport regulator
MPYRTNTDLPFPVRSRLPSHAQDIYREAFNHAFAAWAAVERSYVRVGHRWMPLQGARP